MKKINIKHSKNILLYLVFVLCSIDIQSQDQSFETNSVPSNWSASLGTLSISDKHTKLGDKSLKWNWSANDVLTVSDLHQNGLIEDEVQDYYKNMFRMWIYSEQAISGDSFQIEFKDNNNTTQFYYDFFINYTGWRAASASYRYEMSGLKSNDDLRTLIIKAPSTGSGTMYFDYIDYTMDRNTSRAPDYQLTFINANNNEHWGDLVYFQSLPKTVAIDNSPSNQELTDLAKVKQEYDSFILSSKPGASVLNKAITAYQDQEIEYENGIISGLPLYGTDYSDSQSIAAVDDFIHIFAREYKHNNSNTACLNYFLNSVRYLLDQGYADGSLVETIHHIGYRFRNVAKAIHLMKNELENAGLWDQAQKMVEWYAAIDIIWHPTAHDSNMDDALTRSLPLLGACLYKSTQPEQIQYLKGFRNYAQTWLTTYAKERNGVKVDYTGFHHHVYYPQYAFGSYKSLAQAVNYISSSSFGISSEKRNVFKNILSVARVVMSDDNFSNSLSGRSPFTPISISSAYKNLGLIAPVDEQLIGAYNYIEGADGETNSYPAETPPNGFWQINFSNLGVYRQGNWVADIKGFNKYFWGTEIYTKDNRYGRYQSYGAVEILYPGGHENSGFNINGWNWNMPPGTTSIHLPFEDLKAAINRQDEKTNSNFAASLRYGTKGSYYVDSKLEGTIGIFGMDFTQKDILSGEEGVTSSYNPTFTFKKSMFCFDGKIICLGSNINNNDNTNLTATNLFQNKLNSKSTPITIDNSSTTTFPYTPSPLSSSNNHWILDAYNTGYYIKSGSEIVVTRKNQTSPHENGVDAATTGDFASAYINHNTAPNNEAYEYVIIPGTTATQMQSLSNDMENENTAFYQVIQKNATAHIVKYNSKHGFVLFNNGTYGTTTPIKSNDTPCLVITETAGNNLKLSIMQPDLNFASNYGASQSITTTLVLNGDWSLQTSSGGNVQITAGTNETTLQVDLKDGLPVDIELFSGVYNPFYPTFFYEDFRYNNGTRGYDVQIVKNTDGQLESNLGKTISNIADNTDSNNKFNESRPSVRIPNNTTRDQKAISIVGATSGQNYELEVWIPLTSIDLSSNNPYIDDSDSKKYITFWTQSRYANGGTSSLSALISTDYTNDVTTANWTDVTSQLGNIAKNDDTNNLIYLKSILDISDIDSDNFTLAFKYESNNSAYSLTNRNGTFYISDVHYFTSSEILSTQTVAKENPLIIYPNPTNSKINFKLNIEATENILVKLYNSLGQVVHIQNTSNPIPVSDFKKGVYFLTIQLSNGSIFTKKIMIN